MEDTRTPRAGGIVLGEGGTIALVQHRDNVVWLFPKGHIDEGESDEAAARREIEEETGLVDLELLDDLGTYERPRMHRDNSDHDHEIAVIHMFLFAAPREAALLPTHEIGEARWVSYRDIANVIGNEKDRVWYASVFDRIREAIQRD
jgi:8-oxo-dGTP pyrophosphatase MutT (NUDIX family)